MPEKLKSRKFWFALIAALLPIAAQAMSQEVDMNSAMQASVLVVVAYIFGQGYVDGKSAGSLEGPE
jgi:uncharacterized membrane protein